MKDKGDGNGRDDENIGVPDKNKKSGIKLVTAGRRTSGKWCVSPFLHTLWSKKMYIAKKSV